MSDLKILYKDNKIKLELDGGGYSISEISPSVYIFPYVTGDDGFPSKIGVLGDKNLHVITIPEENLDTDIFATAKRGLKEKTGFDCSNPEQWDFIGLIRNSNHSAEGNPAFSVDITGAVSALENADNDSNDSFNLVTAAQALSCENAIIHCLFLKTFQSKILDHSLNL